MTRTKTKNAGLGIRIVDRIDIEYRSIVDFGLDGCGTREWGFRGIQKSKIPLDKLIIHTLTIVYVHMYKTLIKFLKKLKQVFYWHIRLIGT